MKTFVDRVRQKNRILWWLAKLELWISETLAELSLKRPES